MNRILIVLASVLVAVPAFANLPRSAISKMTIPVYGIYTTADATCQTGLIPTLPLSSTPVTFDMISSPTLGQGKRAKGIQCVIFVVQNSLTMNWAAGTYTTNSTQTNGSGFYSDSLCNAGGTVTTSICNSQVASYPAQVVSDLNALGLAPTTTCTGTGPLTGIIAFYLSTYAGCSGNANITTAGCSPGSTDNPNTFMPPRFPNDKSSGISIAAPPEAGAYRMIIDPDKVLAGNSSPPCGPAAGPAFSFRAK